MAINVLVKCAAQAEVPILRPRYPGVAVALAHHLARRAVERQLQAQGLRVVHVSYAKVLALMDAYKAAHQEELLAQAAALVQRNPKLRARAEQEARELEREQRKRGRATVYLKSPLAHLSANQITPKCPLKRLKKSTTKRRLAGLLSAN